jgi:4-diphosphocytidyl-2-C-methyl-D-erythritol kinase
MTNTIHVPSPAKLNLMLHITGQREDGYHNLQTIFQFLDYGDTLQFTLRNDSTITLSPNMKCVSHDDNLIIRAAKLLQSYSKKIHGIDIHLIKIIPMGGGLGGGSSNAATTLLTLNQLWGINLSLSDLAKLGLQLGADVPIFIHGYSAWAEGVGEEITPLPDIEEPWYLVIHPNVHINTSEIFLNKYLTRNSAPINIRIASTQETRNDCQSLVSKLYPEVECALNKLSKYSPARLTGTGACVFAKFSSKQEAVSAKDQLQTEFNIFIAKGTNLSSAHRVLFGSSM